MSPSKEEQQHGSRPKGPIDLAGTAHRVMTENGFAPDFPPAALAEIDALRNKTMPAPAPAAATRGKGALPPLEAGDVRDMRDLLWSSIDNQESKDLDQIEVAERLQSGDVKVLVGIADVDSLVPKGSAVDRHAAENTTSVYTGVVVFPMLPAALSTGLTSLNAAVDRLAIVVEMVVKAGGEVASFDVYRAVVKNHAKLAYDTVAHWLDGKAPIPPAIAAVRGMEEQIRMQDEVAQKLRKLRYEHGALNLETIEAQPVAKDGDVVALTLQEKNRARELIEDFMIAANGSMAKFLEGKKRSSIRRIVKTPKRWDRIVELAGTLGTKLPVEPDSAALAAFLDARKKADPIHFADLSLSVVKLLGSGEYDLERAGSAHTGHFGLAVQDYTHSTAPNRRFADLVTQRLLKAALEGSPAPYSDAELTDVAKRCTEKEHDAAKVERTMRKVAAAVLLSHRIGESFDGLITGVSPKGTFVRLLSPPAEGRIVRGEAGVDVGDRVHVKLVATEPSKGFIDFVKA